MVENSMDPLFMSLILMPGYATAILEKKSMTRELSELSGLRNLRLTGVL